MSAFACRAKSVFAQAFYNTTPSYVQQPLLEAYAEKATERVFLLPEYCNVTGGSWNKDMKARRRHHRGGAQGEDVHDGGPEESQGGSPGLKSAALCGG